MPSLKNPYKKKSSGFRSGKEDTYSIWVLQLIKCSPNFSWYHAMLVWGGAPSCWNHCSSSWRSLHSLNSTQNCSNTGMVCSFVTVSALSQSSSKKNSPVVLWFEIATYAMHFFEGFLLPKKNQFLELEWPFKRKWASFENQTSFKNSLSLLLFWKTTGT